MKKTAVGVLGGILTLSGVALLVLPGPGFVLIFAGFAVLATQFEWARQRLDDVKAKAAQGVQQVTRSRWQTIFAAACGVALLVAGVLEFTPIDLPLVTTISAVLLIIGGLGLIGTLVFANTEAGRRFARRAAARDDRPEQPRD